MIMRSLSSSEKTVVTTLADALPDQQRASIKADLAKSMVEDVVGDGSRLVFIIDGYDRPEYRGQHAFPIEGIMRDSDKAVLHVALYADENDRLLELEIVRWTGGPVLGPDWNSFKLENKI
jgi:hypothetical protein